MDNSKNIGNSSVQINRASTLEFNNILNENYVNRRFESDMQRADWDIAYN